MHLQSFVFIYFFKSKLLNLRGVCWCRIGCGLVDLPHQPTQTLTWGKRESLAHIHGLSCILTSTVLLLGTPQQRDTAARGLIHSGTLQLAAAQSLQTLSLAAGQVHRRYWMLFQQAVCLVISTVSCITSAVKNTWMSNEVCWWHPSVSPADSLKWVWESRCTRCCSLSVSPVTEDGPLSPWGSNGQLEGGVEVVLLLIWAVDHLPSPDHQEARVSQVGRVQPMTLPVQNHNAGRAAS